MIPLAYGTYGLGAIDLDEAIPAIARAGYDGVELTLADEWRGVSRRIDAAAGRAIGRKISDAGLTLNGFLVRDTVLPGAGRAGMDDETLRTLIESAHHCGAGDDAIITFTMGGAHDEWPTRNSELVARLGELGEIAVRHGAVLAVEPHAKGLIDSVDRAAWLMHTVNHQAIRLNFDISHFALPGMAFDLEEAASRLLPFAVHAHIKDSVASETGFRFVMPGEGALDLPHYFSVLAAHEWAHPVTVEISAQVFNAPQYLPLAAIESTFSALDAARREGKTGG